MLTAGEEFEPFEPHLPLRGMLTYVADEARFTECLTGRDYPLVEDGDYAALEHAYLAAGAEAGGPIMASFDGGIVAGAGGTTATAPSRRCWSSASSASGRARPASGPSDEASLTNTYWKILRLGDDRDRGRRGPARAEPDPARRRPALHRDRRLQPDRRQLHARRATR